MAESTRIALLARAGEARDQLGQALAALGAEVVIAGDPGELAPEGVRALDPSVLVVSLDVAMEDQLDRWEGLIEDPAINVVFDEAEVTRKLAGWDLARWARHLASKILPRSSSLPPAPADARPLAAAVVDAGPADEPIMARKAMDELTGGAQELATPVFDSIEPEAEAEAEAESKEAESKEAEAEEAEAEEVEAEEVEAEEVEAGVEVQAEADTTLDLDFSTTEAAETRLPRAEEDLEAGDFSLDMDLATLDAALAGAPSSDDSAVASRDLESDAPIDDDLSALLAQFDEPPPEPEPDPVPTAEASALDWNFLEATTPEAEPATPPALSEAASTASAGAPAAEPAPASNNSLFANLELVPMDGGTAEASGGNGIGAPENADQTKPVEVGDASGSTIDSVGLDDLVAGLGLADEAPETASVAGAIVLIAGVGGPDAVRQCLGALPSRLPVPVLVWQHLEAANHDRLVPQMARASHVPVYLAAAGEALRSGQIAVLPNGVGVDLTDPEAPCFRESADGPVAGLHALAGFGRDAVVIVLSGADPSVVAAADGIAASGGLLLAQDPATCFDGKAAAALHQAGALIAAPSELAQRAVRHWSN